MYDLEYGGSHILYYLYCKRQLYFYLKQFNLENQSSIIRIASIEHNDVYLNNRIKEVSIGPVKIDLINKNTVAEIKTSKNFQNTIDSRYTDYFFN